MICCISAVILLHNVHALQQELTQLIKSPIITIVKQDSIKEDNSIYCSCIKTARNEGINIPYNTDAKDLQPNSSPFINSLVILKYDDIYHVAVIKDYTDKGFVISEGNKVKCEKGMRILKYNDMHIQGFWNSV